MNEERKETVDRILRAVRIEEVIADYVQVRRVGRRFAAVCPFHNDKAPSLSISPDKGFFHCFGCGAGGNAITFVMKIENVSFSEAVAKLGERVGIKADVSPEKSELQRKRELLGSIIRESALFYYGSLHNGYADRILEYISGRGISDETSRRFGLGYAPSGRSNLLFFLQRKGFAVDDIIESGMAVKYEDGNVGDCFRNRVTIPLLDHMGRFIAMAGRAVDDNSYAKYINSQETPLFTKGRNLFGLNLSKSYVQKEDTAVIVEGYFDMISMWQAGIRNVCAPMGTALTQSQASLLRRFASRVNLLYDSDGAGRNAAGKNVEIFYNAGITPVVSSLPDGYDPDLFVREKGAAAMRRVLSSPLDIMDFFIERQRESCDLSTAAGKSEFVRSLASHLSRLKDMVVLAEYIKRISEEANVSESLVRRIVSGSMQPGEESVPDSSLLRPPEERLVAILFRHPEFIGKVAESLPLSEVSDENVRSILEILFSGDFKEPLKAEDFSACSENEGLTNKIIELLLFENTGAETAESAGALVDELLGIFRDGILRERLRRLKREVEEALSENTLEHDDERFIEYRRLYQYFKGRKI